MHPRTSWHLDDAACLKKSTVGCRRSSTQRVGKKEVQSTAEHSILGASLCQGESSFKASLGTAHRPESISRRWYGPSCPGTIVWEERGALASTLVMPLLAAACASVRVMSNFFARGAGKPLRS